MKRVLLAIDGSPYSDVAVDSLGSIPLAADAIVQVITVETPVNPSWRKDALPTEFDRLMNQFRAESLERLRTASTRLQELAPQVQIIPKLLEGCPKDVIVEEARRWGADLIVVGSHGYGPIRRFFLGSISLFIAHNAPCSVLIARANPDDGDSKPIASSAAL